MYTSIYFLCKSMSKNRDMSNLLLLTDDKFVFFGDMFLLGKYRIILNQPM